MYIDPLFLEDEYLNYFFKKVNYAHTDKCKITTYAPKELLAIRGFKAEKCILVLSGKLRVYNQFINGKNYVLEDISQGAVIGEMEAAGKWGEYTSTVEAATEAKGLVFPHEVYISWLMNSHEFAVDAAMRLGRMMCNSSSFKGENLVFSSGLSIAMLLRRYYVENVGKDGNVIVNETRNQLSEKSGTSLRTVNRSIKTLINLGIITIRKGKIFMDKDSFSKLVDYISENM